MEKDVICVKNIIVFRFEFVKVEICSTFCLLSAVHISFSQHNSVLCTIALQLHYFSHHTTPVKELEGTKLLRKVVNYLTAGVRFKHPK